MDLRNVAEALLRGRNAILPFLAPALSRPHITRSVTIARFQQRASTPQRQCLSTSAVRRKPDAPTSRPPPAGSAPKGRPDRSAASAQHLRDFLNGELDFTKGNIGSTRSPRFKSPRAQAENRTQTPPATDALDDALDADGQETQTQRQTSSSSQSSTAPQPQQQGRQTTELMDILADFQMQGMQGGYNSSRSSRSTGGFSVEDMATSFDPKGRAVARTEVQLPSRLSVQLGPTLGRTVYVDSSKGIDVGRAYRMMEARCARNSVRSDMKRQRFHERAGMRRKRLKSLAWRERFKEGFQAAIKDVTRMTKQGW